jgi:hypothetical protein
LGALDCDALAALKAAAAQNCSASPGRHTLQEAMYALAARLFGLMSSFGHYLGRILKNTLQVNPDQAHI